MTPDEVDALLGQLPSPAPSPLLRERVLADLGRRASRDGRRPAVRRVAWGMALAAALGGFAAVLWVVLPKTPDSPVPSPSGSGRGGKLEDLKFARIEWESSTDRRTVTRTTLSHRQLFEESRDGSLTARDRFTGRVEWTLRIGEGAPLDCPPISSQGLPEQREKAEGELLRMSRQLEDLLKEKGDGKEAQELRKRRDQTRKWLDWAASIDNVYFVSRQVLYCANRTTGALKWTKRLDFVPSSSLVATNMYLFVPDPTVPCVRVLNGEKGGVEVGRYNAQRTVPANSVLRGPLYSDPNIYFVSADGTLHCYGIVEGTMKWTMETEPGPVGGPVLGIVRVPRLSMRRVIFSVGRMVYAIDGDGGNMLWKFDCGAPLTGSPILGGDTVYVRTEKGDLMALQGDPANHRFVRLGWVQGGCEEFLMRGRKTVYLLGAKREILAVNEATGEVVERHPLGAVTEFLRSPSDGLLYALRPEGIACLKERD